MYYGKADASAVSSGANTFIVFDDFERGANGDAVGGAWTVVAGAVQISTEQAYGGTRCGKILGGATYAIATIPVTSSDNIAIRCRTLKETAALQSIQHSDGGGSGWGLAFRFEVDEDLSIYDGASYVVKGTGTADTWQLFELNNFVWASATCDLWLENVQKADNADISYAEATYANKFAVSGFSNAAGVDWYIDDLIVRNYRTTEPAWGSWGGEELEGSASMSPSESPSVSPSLSPSMSPSESPSASPSLSPSASVSPSTSPSESPSESASESPSASERPSLS